MILSVKTSDRVRQLAISWRFSSLIIAYSAIFTSSSPLLPFPAICLDADCLDLGRFDLTPCSGLLSTTAQNVATREA
jgi:hypothetical protein